MWHTIDHNDNKFGFEVLRPNEDGDLDVLQCSAWFNQYRLVIEGPDNSHTLFDNLILTTPHSVDFNGEYLIAYYDGFYIQLKVEDGLVIDVWEDNDDASSPMWEATIWWDDL